MSPEPTSTLYGEGIVTSRISVLAALLDFDPLSFATLYLAAAALLWAVVAVLRFRLRWDTGSQRLLDRFIAWDRRRVPGKREPSS